MRRTSRRVSRGTRSGSPGEVGVSLVDALVALIILVLALSVATTPIVAATLRARSLAARTADSLNARQAALETGVQP